MKKENLAAKGRNIKDSWGNIRDKERNICKRFERRIQRDIYGEIKTKRETQEMLGKFRDIGRERPTDIENETSETQREI